MSQRGRLVREAPDNQPARRQALILKIAAFTLALFLGTTLTGLAQNSTPSKSVTLLVDGGLRQVYSTKETVQTLLWQENVVLKGLDRCEPSLETPLTDGMVIAVTRVSKERVTRRTTIPAPVENRLDSRLYTTQRFEMQQGRSGLVQETVVVWKRDGQVSSQEVQSRKVIRRTRPTIILKGTLPATSRAGLAVRRVMTVSATAYDPGPLSCGPNCTGRTATGMRAGRGVIAVDPRVIPLGSRVFVDGYGMAIAADTGGAIKGNKIDVCFPTRSEALRWGRRTVKIMILQ